MEKKPVHIRDLIKGQSGSRGKPSTGLKLLVVDGSSHEETNAASWITEAVVEGMSKLDKDLHRSVVTLPATKIHACVGCYGGGGRVCRLPCDRNDPESDIFEADDAMAKVYERVTDADIVLVSTDARWGSCNSHTQRFLERLAPFANIARDGRYILRNKVAGVVVVGDGAHNVAGHLMGTLNEIGFAFPQHGHVAWHVPRLVNSDNVRSAYEKASNIHDDSEKLAGDLMRFAKLLLE